MSNSPANAAESESQALETIADAMADAVGYPRHTGHSWVESSGFAGRFCSGCGIDEDDEDDPRRLACPAVTQ